jgi:hypothetical protein
LRQSKYPTKLIVKRVIETCILTKVKIFKSDNNAQQDLTLAKLNKKIRRRIKLQINQKLPKLKREKAKALHKTQQIVNLHGQIEMPIFVTKPNNSPFEYRSIERLYNVLKKNYNK